MLLAILQKCTITYIATFNKYNTKLQ
uniref:Uncharacterized protein n=1 Tax=Anguilla anguilla TaxID=7936 RepID=A0A0E9RUT0_ANGAN